MFNSFNRRGFAAAMLLALALVGGSSEAFGQNAPALQHVIAAQSPQSILQSFNPAIRAITTPAPPVRRNLGDLVEQYATGPALDEQQNCLATAVYFESMGNRWKASLPLPA